MSRLKPWISVEEFQQWEADQAQCEREAVAAMLEREKAIKPLLWYHVFGWACASAAIVLLGYEAWTWINVWLWSDL